MKTIFDIKDNEQIEDYVKRICAYHDELNMTWQKIADVISERTGLSNDESTYRKKYKRMLECESAEKNETFERELELKKEKVRISDERRQLNCYVRRIAREETLKEIAIEVAENMNGKKLLTHNYSVNNNSGKEAILELSDVHYGAVVDNYWNKYDPEITKKYFSKLIASVKQRCFENNVSVIHVVNLGDLINGYIHLGLRLQNRIDIITQTIEISEILAEFLFELSKSFKIKFYSCLDNHSRLDPNKQDSLDLESLGRIIPWYLQERLKNNVEFFENKYDYDIINFDSLGYKVIGVHGHKDKIGTVVEKLSMLTHEHYDLVLTAHLHHFSCDEQNETIVVSNGSMLGTDTFAKNLRLSSKPSQNLIIVSNESVVDCIYRIVLG